MSNSERKPYILTNQYTVYLYSLLIIITIYYTYKVYLYDMEMNRLKLKQWQHINNNKNKLQVFKEFSTEDTEMLNAYISYIIDKKKMESNKFNKIVNSFKNGMVTGFLASSLSGSTIPSSLLTGLTFASTNALYKSLLNYNTYQKLKFENIINV